MSGGLPRPQGHPLGSCGVVNMAMVLAIAMGDMGTVTNYELRGSCVLGDINGQHTRSWWMPDVAGSTIGTIAPSCVSIRPWSLDRSWTVARSGIDAHHESPDGRRHGIDGPLIVLWDMIRTGGRGVHKPSRKRGC